MNLTVNNDNIFEQMVWI